jgi:hypothetical protein
VPTSIHLQGPLTGDRSEAESFVRQAFLTAYTARIEQFLPTLMALRNGSGRLLAVLGLRNPGNERLFLEQYLDQSVEQLLAKKAACPVDRSELIEVGNFAVGAAGGGRWLITALTAYLYATGRSWAVFTCGPMLRNAFDRLGIELVDLAVADPGRLAPEESLRWGSYYDNKPRVMAANVSQSHTLLSALYEKECALSLLWLGALQAGRLAA